MKKTYQVGDMGYFGKPGIGQLRYQGTIVEISESYIIVEVTGGSLLAFEKEEAPPEFYPGDLVKFKSYGTEVVGVLGHFTNPNQMWRIETANGRYTYSRNLLQKATWNDLRRFLNDQAVLKEVPI